MQTFLPYQSYDESAGSLDKKRCWKQVVETKQILCKLQYECVPDDWKTSKSWTSQGWSNHPAVKMWVGYETSLANYYNVFLDYCLLVHKINTTMAKLQPDRRETTPWWLGDESFHRAMRARLIEKDRDFYLPRFPNDEGYNGSMYWWPVMETKTFKTI